MRFALLFLCLLLLAGCSVPRVIVLNDPLDAREHNDLGVSYEARGEHDLALQKYARSAELDETWAQPLINRGNVLASRQDWSGAVESFRHALAREPGHAEAMNNLAWVLLQAGEVDRALPWAAEAVAIAPENPAFLDTLAEIRLRRGEFEAAALLLDRALAQSPSPDLRRSLEAKRSQSQ